MKDSLKTKLKRIPNLVRLVRLLTQLIYIVVNNLKFIFKIPIFYLSKLSNRNKNIWLLSSTHGTTISDNSRAIFEFLNQKEQSEIDSYYIVKERCVYNRYKEKYSSRLVYKYSFKGFYLMLKSGVYIYTHYVDDISFCLSGGAITINTFHGIALKKIHFDNKFDRARNPKNFLDRLEYFGKCFMLKKSDTYICATSKYMRSEYARAFNKDLGQVVITGYPRNDVLSPTQMELNKSEFLYKYRLKNNFKKFLFYLPTHRKNELSVLNELNLEKVNEYCVAKNLLFLYKPHPYSNVELNTRQLSNILIIEKNDDLYPILSFMDILVTDYSSIFFDWLLLKRPVIFFAPDIEEYISESRKLYYDYEKIVPGPITKQNNELLVEIRKLIESNSNIDEFSKERELLLNKFFDFHDFESTARFVSVFKEELINIEYQN